MDQYSASVDLDRPLFVDLDGTLLRTDTLYESALRLLKRNPLYAALLPIWLLGGRANLKRQIASRIDLNVANLPYHKPFLAYLRQQRNAGRRLILASGSDTTYVQAVADYVGLFSNILASDGTTNLTGSKKLERIRGFAGDSSFDYAGNAREDLTILSASDRAILINPSSGVLRSARLQGIEPEVIDDRTGPFWQAVLRALRPHQWLKNLLLFIAPLMAHRIAEPAILGQAILGFVAFGLCASSVYVLNDLLDLSDDRLHPRKKNRPFASGDLPIGLGLALIPLLLAAAFAISLLLPIAFTGVLATYYTITLAYSLCLKRAALVDVVVLAALYAVRIIAGAAAVSIALSSWLLAFALFLFLSLAMVKRYTELLTIERLGRRTAAGRGYEIGDKEILSQFGSASGFLAVLVLALYVNSENVADLYRWPAVIWGLCPLVLYIVMRMWFLARRDGLQDDPVVFVLTDWRSLLACATGGLLLLVAT